MRQIKFENSFKQKSEREIHTLNICWAIHVELINQVM